MENIQLNNFITSHKIGNHPLVIARNKTKKRYLSVLTYFVNQYKGYDEYTSARLSQYRTVLIGGTTMGMLTKENCDSAIRYVINNFSQPWTRKQGIWLMCDFALITEDRMAIKRAQEAMRKFLGKKQNDLLGTLVDIFFNEDAVPQKLLFAKELISQFRINLKFSSQPQMRVLITANMSAGKSTLINALVGKTVTRTSQEVCTANLCYLYDKPFEDNSIHLLNSQLNLNASYSDLMNLENSNASSIASYFRKLVTATSRVCLIDSPGVNSAMNHNHAEMTRKALLNEKYDRIIYVLNASKLGTDDEIRYLKYISENVPKDKVVFVLNKLDAFKSKEDSVAMSFVGVRNELLELGFANPIICPLSAYCALLVKMKKNGEVLTADEEDDYCFYVRKFSKAEYDLSIYFNDANLPVSSIDDELLTLSRKCGLYGLETILYGGMVQ